MSIFSTKDCDQAKCDELIALALDEHGKRNQLAWPEVTAATGIKYSRAWLVVRRAELERSQPGRLVDLAKVVADAQAAYDAAVAEIRKDEPEAQFEPFNPEQAKADQVRRMIEVDQDSWGEAMCRLGMSEGQVRKLYRAGSGLSDLGRRNGHGGKFLNSDPTLYLAHRRGEGAAFDAGTKRAEMKVTNAINADAKKAEVVPQVKAENSLFVANLEATIAASRAARAAKRTATRKAAAPRSTKK